MTRTQKLWNTWKKQGTLSDRREYDKEDLKSAYPHLKIKEVNILHKKLRRI